MNPIQPNATLPPAQEWREKLDRIHMSINGKARKIVLEERR